MRACCCLENPILASVRCNDFGITEGIMLGIAVIGAATSGIGLIAQQSASAQAASNAQAVANYNAQIQEQNAQMTYQIQVQQAQYTQQAAQANQRLALYNQQLAGYNAQVAASQAESQKQFFAYSKQVSQANAQASQQRYDAQLQQAQALEQEGEARRAQSREEARRLREENDRKTAMIRGKYAASGVAFEGSPLVVLADAARLAETAVQDQAYVGELEARKQFRAGVLQKFEAGFTLLDKANYEREAYAADIQGQNAQYAGLQAQSQAAGQAYEAQIQGLNYENQILAAQYDTYVAAAQRKSSLYQADLTRLGGEAQASNIRAESTASLFGGIANITGSVGSGITNAFRFAPAPQARSVGVVS